MMDFPCMLPSRCRKGRSERLRCAASIQTVWCLYAGWAGAVVRLPCAKLCVAAGLR
jgi:hypothetical protein